MVHFAEVEQAKRLKIRKYLAPPLGTTPKIHPPLGTDVKKRFLLCAAFPEKVPPEIMESNPIQLLSAGWCIIARFNVHFELEL